MSGIFGHLNVSDSDRVINTTGGQRAVYEAAMDYINRVNTEVDRLLSVFVARDTENYKLRYKLPGGGYLQQRQADGRFGAVKAYGYWDVALPLKDFGAMISGNDVDMAYMTVGELENHINTVVAQYVNTARFEVLEAILDNTQETWTDPLYGSLSVEPLANGDTVTYPPVIGSTSEATEDHYLYSGYTAANISDTNDPYSTLIADVEHHFGMVSGGSNLVTFINTAQVAKTAALTDYVDIPDQFVRVGDDTAVPAGLPQVPGRVIGRHSEGTWIVEWSHIPANYMVTTSLDAEAPLLKRVDPADTGLPRGLALVATDEEFPFQSSTWRVRFGVGAGNRLNGAVMFLTSGSSYTVPTGY